MLNKLLMVLTCGTLMGYIIMQIFGRHNIDHNVSIKMIVASQYKQNLQQNRQNTR